MADGWDRRLSQRSVNGTLYTAELRSSNWRPGQSRYGDPFDGMGMNPRAADPAWLLAVSEAQSFETSSTTDGGLRHTGEVPGATIGELPVEGAPPVMSFFLPDQVADQPVRLDFVIRDEVLSSISIEMVVAATADTEERPWTIDVEFSELGPPQEVLKPPQLMSFSELTEALNEIESRRPGLCPKPEPVDLLTQLQVQEHRAAVAAHLQCYVDNDEGHVVDSLAMKYGEYATEGSPFAFEP